MTREEGAGQERHRKRLCLNLKCRNKDITKNLFTTSKVFPENVPNQDFTEQAQKHMTKKTTLNPSSSAGQRGM